MDVLKPDSSKLQTLLNQLMHPYLKEIDLSLDRMKRYLEYKGNPQLRIPPVIHVAGTNGKGSTIAFMRSALEAAGYSCHVYTSPHLVSFRERIVLAGTPVSEEQLLPVLESIHACYESHPFTFFEATTAAAFELFAEYPADVVLLEVGMGGQFDATNVITPIASVITPVSMDHQAFLGDTIDKIAYEKACIAKADVPVFVAPQAPKAMEVIKEYAKSIGAPMHEVKMQQFESLGLQGAHQQQNASVAYAVLETLKDHFSIDGTRIREAFTQASWPARLQQLHMPLPDGWEAFVDGGHNDSAAKATATWMAAQAQPVHVICSMVQGKDVNAYIGTIAAHASSFTTMAIPDEPMGVSAADMHNIAKLHVPRAHGAETLEDALNFALSHQGEGIVLWCGSLYFAGKVLESFPS